MFQQPNRREPELDFEQIIGRIRNSFGGFGGRLGGGSIFTYLVLGILLVAFIIWMATGVYQVSPGEQAAIRTFGKCCKIEGEGLHWYWPAPIGTRNVVSTEEIRAMELGFNTVGEGEREVLEEAQMIAGDLNIVDVPLVIQYRIKDLEAFLFKVADPGEGLPNRRVEIAPGRPDGRTLKDATEAALRLVVGQRPIDDVLTDNKTQVQLDTQVLLQEILDSYGAGIEITAVLLQTTKAPQQVREAFQDVTRARQEKEALENEALAFQEDILPKARGNAAKITESAEAFRQAQIARATGQAERFKAILSEYEKAEDVTRQRLYLEAMEEILPGVTKFIVSPQAGGNLLQILPLEPGAQFPPAATVAPPAPAIPTPTPSPGG
jgi:membrane protease subunit HflK